MIPVLPDRISTPRLLLRPHQLDDVDRILADSTDEEWARYLPVPVPYQRCDAEKFLASQVLLDRVAHPSWAIVLGDSVIGGINIRFTFEARLGEMGYAVARRVWGQGLATEAAQAVIDASFRSHPDLNRIRATADARNRASQRVMEKVGMTKEGLHRQDRVRRGELVDVAYYGILRSEWDARPRLG
jgi:ribosomal-protein-alanine N-acetyltransferase